MVVLMTTVLSLVSYLQCIYSLIARNKSAVRSNIHLRNLLLVIEQSIELHSHQPNRQVDLEVLSLGPTS